MRFLAFQICFFSILFTAKAEKNLLATYNKEIWPFNYSIQDSIKNAVVYYSNIQVVTNTGVLVLDKANQHYFTQSSDRLHRFYPSFLDVNYLDKSLFYMLMGNAYLDNNLSIDSYFSNCTLIQSDMDRCYVVQHDSLYLVSNLARYFIY